MSSLLVDEVPSINWYFNQMNKDNFINDAHDDNDHDHDVHDFCDGGDDDRDDHDASSNYYWWWLSWSTLACVEDVHERIQQP